MSRHQNIGTGRAAANMALIKYWGKRDTQLYLPTTGSLSLPLTQFVSTTTCEASDDGDVLYLNGVKATTGQHQKAWRVIQQFRALTGQQNSICVRSHNNFPTAQGLASSASGLAALTKAANQYYGTKLAPHLLSMIARQGSGSAARSIERGIMLWHKGRHRDGIDSYAEPIQNSHAILQKLQLAFVTILTPATEKDVSSTVGMRLENYPRSIYNKWVRQNTKDLKEILEAFHQLDLPRIGDITERNFMRLHLLIESAHKPIRYWKEDAPHILGRIRAMRQSGLPAWATMDAGHIVTILTTRTASITVASMCEDFGTTIIHDLTQK